MSKTKIDESCHKSRSRQRGYSFEDSIVNNLSEVENWHAFRLGGTTITMPDIIAVNNNQKIFLSMEAKSTTKTNTYVPEDQIKRCIEILDKFPLYLNQYVVFPFKFSRNRRVYKSGIKKDGTRTNNNKKVITREKKEYYVIIPRENLVNTNLTRISCGYDGIIRRVSNGPIEYQRMDSFVDMVDYIESISSKS